MADGKNAKQDGSIEQESRSILINFVLDASGSMQSIREATIEGFNAFLTDQQEEGGSAQMTLTLFNTRFDTVARAVPVREVLPLERETYRPEGSTALYDAIAHTMQLTDDHVAAHVPDQVLFVIMTDGMENASREFDREAAFRMIRDRQDGPGYEFIYLGANQDSYAVSRSLGMHEGRSMDFVASADGARATMTRVSHNVRGYRRKGDKSLGADEWFRPEHEDLGAADYSEHKARLTETRRRAGGEGASRT